ncbi:MAG: hypothetical protein NC311_10885 [Muribaculaceae bacterium]|nr:hypothetical protein [Muribaculaceae bacterium]
MSKKNNSILDTTDENGRLRCFSCGSTRQLERHHVFGGALRSKSERYGLTVSLCHFCHNEAPYGVHHNAAAMQALKAIAQRRAMAHYGWSTDDFIREFGKNYL